MGPRFNPMAPSFRFLSGASFSPWSASAPVPDHPGAAQAPAASANSMKGRPIPVVAGEAVKGDMPVYLTGLGTVIRV